MIKDIGFTIYAVTDIKKSREFYESTLGLVRSKEFEGSEFWVEYNVGSGTFAIGCSPEWKPSRDGAVIAFEVDDFDTAIDALKAKNVTFFMQPSVFPTCSMAVIEDPDRNKVLIHKKK